MGNTMCLHGTTIAIGTEDTTVLYQTFNTSLNVLAHSRV